MTLLSLTEKVCPELCSELFHPENLPFVESMFGKVKATPYVYVCFISLYLMQKMTVAQHLTKL